MGSGVASVNLCIAIKAHKSSADLVNYAEQQEWPLEIDFSGIPERVMLFQEGLNDLIKDATVLVDSMAWKTFIEKLSQCGIPLRRFRTLDWKIKQDLYCYPAG